MLARSEWRRRLGSAAYSRPHPPSLIRALVGAAVRPQADNVSRALERALSEEITSLEAWGLNRRQMRDQLLVLSDAIRDVLTWNESESDRHVAGVGRIEQALEEALGWPV